jgi:hypothetical protein
LQAYVDAVLDLASHFITRLRRYASFCRTLASHAVTAGAGSNRNMVTSPTQSSATPATSQGQYVLIFPKLKYEKNKILYVDSIRDVKFYNALRNKN